MQARVVAWSAWAPGVSSIEDWRLWALSPTRFAPSEKPKTETLTPLQRRRCTPGTMVATHLLERLRGVSGDVILTTETTAMVFGSRHGESGVTNRILRSLADNEDISPTDFMLSVHNSVAGMCSIAFSDTAPHSAVAARGGSMAACLLESLGYLRDSRDRVFCIFVDDSVAPAFCTEPDLYDPYFGVGLLLERCGPPHGPTKGLSESQGPALQFSWSGSSVRTATTPAGGSEPLPFPDALNFVSWLLGYRAAREECQTTFTQFSGPKCIDLPLGGGRLSVLVDGATDPAGVFV